MKPREFSVLGIVLMTITFSAFFQNCRQNTVSTSHTHEKEIQLDYAKNLKIFKGDGYNKVTIRNPWDTTKTLHTYILVAHGSPLPSSLPEGAVIRVPLKRSLVYSSVHTSLIEEIGNADAIAGVCDADMMTDPFIISQLKSGKIEDCGNSSSPTIERIMKLKPDGILLSPYENSGSYGPLGGMGIPIIECADYMEDSPLGRAEWMKFFGMLYGKESEADSIFVQTVAQYESLRQLAKNTKSKPVVLVDRLYGQSWHVPRSESTMGKFISDAGGVNPFGNNKGYGSMALSGEQVLHDAGDANIWIMRYAQSTDKTIRELGQDNALYPRFKAFKEGNVYGCNTSAVPYFDEVPFHPQWLLRHLIHLFHPEIIPSDSIHIYFTRLNP